VSIDVKTVPLNCSSYVIDGDCIRGLYNLPAQNNNRKVSSTNALGKCERLERGGTSDWHHAGIFEEGENYDKADLKLWIKNFAPYIPIDTIPEESNVDGGIGPVPQANGGGEALLDITIAYELIYPQVVNVFSVDDPYEAENTSGFMDTWLDAVDGSFCTYSAFGQTGDNNTVDPVYPDPHQGG
jgi:tripeptidyl-peptidase-1